MKETPEFIGLTVKIDGYNVEFRDKNQIELVQHLIALIDQWKDIANVHKNAINNITAVRMKKYEIG